MGRSLVGAEKVRGIVSESGVDMCIHATSKCRLSGFSLCFLSNMPSSTEALATNVKRLEFVNLLTMA